MLSDIGTYSDYRADPGTTPKPGPGLPPHAQNHTFRETPPPPLTRNHALRAHRLLARPAIARTGVLGGGPWGQNGIGHAALDWAWDALAGGYWVRERGCCGSTLPVITRTCPPGGRGQAASARVGLRFSNPGPTTGGGETDPGCLRCPCAIAPGGCGRGPPRGTPPECHAQSRRGGVGCRLGLPRRTHKHTHTHTHTHLPHPLGCV